MKTIQENLEEQIEDLLSEYQWCKYLVIVHRFGNILKAIPVYGKPNVETAMLRLKKEYANIGNEFEVYEKL